MRKVLWLQVSPLRLAIALIVLAVAGVVLFAWSGLYNVGASSGHFAVTRALLKLGLHGSVRTHSLGIEVPPLDDPDLVRLGAGHFAGACAPCHGAPGMRINRVTAGMLPPPPDLSTVVGDWRPRELFWIVRNGIKYTGMPAWPALSRDDEVWSLVAFLEALPHLSAAEYERLANLPATKASEARPRSPGTFSEALTACARCHGDDDLPPSSRLVPRLAGQSRAYLAAALQGYADGFRHSGIMQPVAAELGAGDIEALAGYYAALEQGPAETPAAPADAAAVERGRLIARSGLPQSGVPACLACHGQDAAGLFPRLAGQHAPYLVSQLRAFRSGSHGRTAAGDIMEVIAAPLTDTQIGDAAAYFSSLETRALRADAAAAAGKEAR